MPSHTRTFTTSPAPLTPQPPTSSNPSTPTPLSTETYHALSDSYIDSLLHSLETLAESSPDIDVEYSSGVLTLVFPPQGTYVLNKQPPNRQIWLSSPVSGPKRYDWVVGEGEDGEGRMEEGGDGKGRWVYLRDGSTLDGLLKDELGVEAGAGGEE